MMDAEKKQELIRKIIEKKEFSKLPSKDVEKTFELFDKERYVDSEKVKLTRDLLRKSFSGFTSRKILSLKDKDAEWILRKHLSTRERLPFYEEVYQRLLKGLKKDISIVDLGAGINGFSFEYFKKVDFKVKYVGVEAVGQLVDLMNYYFKNNNFSAKAIHLSLFDLEKVRKIIQEVSKPKVLFLFKVLDSLEMLEKNYSKKLLLEIVPLAERVVVSFATRSMLKRTRFKVDRTWIIKFLEENFNVLEDFEIGSERYIVFKK